MARPPQHADGAYGVPDVTRESGGFPGPPNVYHPWAESTPAYEEYADPAAAHGWENAYDQTRELPSVAADVPAVVRGSGPGRRGARRKPAARRSRRALVAVGAVGVSAAALIAGFSLSGSSRDGSPDPKGGGTRSVPDEPTGSTGAASPAADPPVRSDAPVAAATDGTGASAGASAGAGASRGPAAGATQAGAPSPTPSAELSSAPSASASAPTAPAVTASGPGGSDRKGRGRGGTKAPK
jgi:hypothetical protein